MIDHIVKARTGKAYDKDGELAAKGTIIPELNKQLLQHQFFSRTPPRSAWRLDFGATYADDVLSKYKTSSTEDLLATLTMFTALSIERAVVENILPKVKIDTLIASGGGVRNATLVRFLRERLRTHGVEVKFSDEYGLPAPY